MANDSVKSSQAGTTKGTDIAGLQSRSRIFGGSVCSSMFCLHIKFLTRKAFVSEFPLYRTNSFLVASIRCSPGQVSPPILPACPSHIAPPPPYAPCPHPGSSPWPSHMPFSAACAQCLCSAPACWKPAMSRQRLLSDVAMSSLVFHAMTNRSLCIRDFLSLFLCTNYCKSMTKRKLKRSDFVRLLKSVAWYFIDWIFFLPCSLPFFPSFLFYLLWRWWVLLSWFGSGLDLSWQQLKITLICW